MDTGIKTVFKNSIYIKVTKYLFPAILLIYAFIGINRGIDITDVGYNLGNYKYLSELDGMWFYSTFLANIIGALFTHLPFGSYMLGMEVYCCILKALFSLWAYRFFVKETGVSRESAFIGMFISLSLCWAPQICIYHYLSYYMLFVTGALIFLALKKERDSLLVAAGVIAALSISVRFPNVCYAALIVAVWYHAYLKRAGFKSALIKTLKCMAGYFAALAAGGLALVVTGKTGDYITAIKELFSMTGESERYGLWFTIRNLINSYTCVWYWLIPVGLAAVMLFIASFFPGKFKALFHTLAVIGMAVVYLWYKKTALFDYDFTSYSSMYLFGVVILCVSLVLFAVTALSPKFSDDLRILSVIAIVIQFITPLGTNNSLYVVLNSLFFPVPTALAIISEMSSFKRMRYVHTAFAMLFLMFAVQMAFFYNGFTFREKQHEPQNTYIEGNTVLEGMKTTPSNAELLNELTAIWNENAFYTSSVLTFGDMPGLAYYLDSHPALSSTWPILDSYSVSKFAAGMEDLKRSMASDGERVIVVTDFYLDRDGAKQEMIKDFINEYDYTTIYDDHGIKVWVREGETTK